MRRATAFAILIWLPLSAALADVFKSVDAQGHVEYSDTPTPGAQVLRMNSQHVPVAPETRAPANASRPPAASASDGDPIHQQLEREAAAREVQIQVAQTRAEQCKKATDIYNQAVQARRIYTTGPDGERQFLSDDDADKERVAHKLEMDAACKAAGQ
jgi:hypothetical protein